MNDNGVKQRNNKTHDRWSNCMGGNSPPNQGGQDNTDDSSRNLLLSWSRYKFVGITTIR